MRIADLEHINITAPKPLIEEVLDFYTQVLGFEVGSRPNFKSDGYWLYAGAKPILHLTIGEGVAVRNGAAFNHVAYKVSDLNYALDILDNKNIKYSRSEVTELNQVQLFLKDPAGVGVELNFDQGSNA